MKKFLRKLFLFSLVLLPLPALAEEMTKANLFGLSYGEAEEAISRALADKGAAEKVAAFINGRKDDALFSYTKPLSIEIRGLQFDKSSNHWSGNLLAIADGQVITAIPAAGRFDALAEIPVLKRTVKNGETIDAKDIEIRDVAMSQVRSDTVTDIASIIGRSPAYSITAGRPLREHEIAMPPLVRKNSVVQMHFRSPGMEISTSGQAMEDGAKGTMINVKNLASKKIIQAVVDDVSSVSVATTADKSAENVQPSNPKNPDVRDLYATN